MAADPNTLRHWIGTAEQLAPFVRRPSDTIPNEIYRGSVALPGDRQRAQAYVKVFPAESRRQLVYNEVVGYEVAIQLGLPAPLTFPCICRPSQLRRAPQPKVAGGASGDEYVLAIASVDARPNAIQQTLQYSRTLWADVMNWPPIARVAVFDELMGNEDRHPNNLVRCGPHSYMLIDNERILFGEPWFGTDLAPLRDRECGANILASWISEGTDEFMKAKMLQAANHLVLTTELRPTAQMFAIEAACRAPPGTTEALFAMLNGRRQRLPRLLQWHMRKGDLFQSGTLR
jgi:hypothetical protein